MRFQISYQTYMTMPLHIIHEWTYLLSQLDAAERAAAVPNPLAIPGAAVEALPETLTFT